MQSHSLSFGSLVWLSNIEGMSVLKAEPVDRLEKEYNVHYLVPEKNMGAPYEGLWLIERDIKDHSETGVRLFYLGSDKVGITTQTQALCVRKLSYS